jgi:MFS family permease
LPVPGLTLLTARHPNEFFGWWVVGACFVMATACWGLGFYGNGLYLAHLVRERGWPISLIGFSFTFYFWLGAFLVIATGRLVDRIGPRWSCSLGMLSATLGVLLIARVQVIWHLYFGLSFLALGWAWMSGAAINSILARWFDAKRGTALSIALTGASMGGILVQPLMTWGIERWGFADGLTVVALTLAVVVLVTLAFGMVRSPSLLGQYTDGTANDKSSGVRAGKESTGPQNNREVVEPWGIFELVRMRAFVSNVLPFSLGLLAQVGFLTHQITMVEEQYSRTVAAIAVVVTTASAMFGRLLAGYFADRVSRRKIAAANFLVQAVGVLVLISFHSPLMLYVACGLYGLAVGNLIAFPGLIIQREFPREQFVHVNRWAIAITQGSYALGPALLGAIRQATGSYVACLEFCAFVGCLSAVIVWFGRPNAE